MAESGFQSKIHSPYYYDLQELAQGITGTQEEHLISREWRERENVLDVEKGTEFCSGEKVGREQCEFE